MFLTNKPKLKNVRRKLRRQQTQFEYILWQKLRNKQLGYKFYRQFSIGPYILDFFCHQKKLAIELDGSYHGEEKVKESDQKRDEFLQSLQIKVLRIQNAQVKNNITGVIEYIVSYL